MNTTAFRSQFAVRRQRRSDDVQVGVRDGLRFGGVCAVVIAALLSELTLRRNLVRHAARAERARIARDLHDGIAQDLAFIAAYGAMLSEESGEEHPLVVAARRALAISRGTIDELNVDDGTTAGDALQALAVELGNRFAISVDVDARGVADVSPGRRDDTVRIAREAIANAARHGRARRVGVSLRARPSGTVLRVRDDGCGIDRAHVREGFGIRSMRERAAALGGTLRIASNASGGVDLEVELP